MKLILALVCISISAAASAAVLKMAADKGKTEFKALGVPSSLRIEGQGAGPTGELTAIKQDGKIKISGELQVPLKTLDTGIELRDKHMKNKYLEVDKYDSAILIIDQVLLPVNLSEGVLEKAAFAGRLKLHGVEKSISGEGEFKRVANNIQLDSHFSIKISDYGILIPQFAGITVADEVKIHVATEVPWSDKL